MPIAHLTTVGSIGSGGAHDPDDGAAASLALADSGRADAVLEPGMRSGA